MGGQRQSEGQRITNVSDANTTAIVTRGGPAEAVSDVKLLPVELEDTMYESCLMKEQCNLELLTRWTSYGRPSTPIDGEPP